MGRGPKKEAERFHATPALRGICGAPDPICTGRSLECKFNPTHMPNLEQKTARLTVLIDPSKKKAFESLCAAQDVTPSQVVRRLIRDYLRQHGMQWTPGDGDDSGSGYAPLE